MTLDADDEDFEAIRATTMDRFAGVWVALVGVFTCTLGAQSVAVALATVVTVVGLVQLMLGVGTLAAGVLLTRRRGTGALGALVLCLVVGVLTIAWDVFLLVAATGLSLVGLALPFFALVGAVLAGVALPGALKADKARLRLREAGLATGG